MVGHAKHILEFSSKRDDFFEDLKNWFFNIDGANYG